LKALVLHGVADLRLENEWPRPDVPNGWVLVRVEHAGICGSDLPRMMKYGAHKHPLICGHELAGHIELSRSTRFAEGDRVAVLPNIPCGTCAMCKKGEEFHCVDYDFIGSRRDGGFAEYCAVPEDNLLRLPRQVDTETGALIEPILVALHAVRASHLKATERVLVLGGGPIGNLIAQWARIGGTSRIVVADIKESALVTAEAVGLKTRTLAGDSAQRVEQYDVVFEAAGANEALSLALRSVGHKGRIIVIGRQASGVVVSTPVFESFMRKEAAIIGCWGYKARGEARYLRHVLRRGLIQIKPLISHRIDIVSSVGFIQSMWDGKLQYSKVLLEFGDDHGC